MPPSGDDVARELLDREARRASEEGRRRRAEWIIATMLCAAQTWVVTELRRVEEKADARYVSVAVQTTRNNAIDDKLSDIIHRLDRLEDRLSR